MAAMNAGGGGAFGGMSLMNNGANGGTPRAGSDQGEYDFEARLNGYIYDYLLKTENYSTAKSMLESGVTMYPNTKARENPNGTDDALRPDSKEDMESKRAGNLPPTYPDASSSFLLDWFSVFWDFYFARTSNPSATQNTKSFLSHTQARNRQEREQQLSRGTAGGMMSSGLDPYGSILRMTNAVPMSAELRQKAIQNNRNSFAQPTAHQLAQFNQQHVQLRQLQRDDSELNINGQRPRSPSSVENAPSPSKRPRLEGVPNFTGQIQMMQNGRTPQGLQGQNMMTPNNNANGLLIRAGIDPKTIPQAQLNAFQNRHPSFQQKSIEVYAQNQRAGRPSLQNPGMQGQNPDLMAGIDINNSGAGPEYRFAPSVGLHQSGPPVPSPAGGNHALQDYQMQLMLLEQQNKKRLLMARQGQEIVRPDGQPGMQGGPNFAPGMSPSGSRSGPSPGPNEQIKRGTPKMGQVGLPNGGSPMPDGTMPQGRDSPAAGGYNGQIPDMYTIAPGMRPPPGSHAPYSRPQMTREQVEVVQRNHGVGQMSNATWAPGQTPIMQQQLPQTPQPSQGTPQQRAMPPPTGLPTAPTTNGKPASPAQPPAPPTPLPATKANPKVKKSEEKPRKRPPKKATATSVPTPAPPIADLENPPPTPTPATPSTPTHPQSFTTKNDTHNATNLMPASITATAPAPLTQQPDSGFGGLDGDNTYEMNNPDFMSGDVLENFDFDSFLQSTEDAPFTFDPAAITFTNPDAVEAGGGDA